MSQNNLDNAVGKPLAAANLREMGVQIDNCFLPLGLQKESGIGIGKYTGELNGRSVTITIAMRTRSRYVGGTVRYRKFTGLWLDASVSTPIMSRLMLGQPTGAGRRFAEFVQRLYGNKPVVHLAPNYESFMVYAHDPSWAEIFLGDTAVQTQLITLMQNPNLPSGAAVFLSPGSWKWSTPAMPESFTPEAAEVWLQQLVGLAARAEQNPPDTAVQPNWLERQSSTVRAVALAGLLLFGIPSLLFLCCILPILALIIWGRGL